MGLIEFINQHLILSAIVIIILYFLFILFIVPYLKNKDIISKDFDINNINRKEEIKKDGNIQQSSS